MPNVMIIILILFLVIAINADTDPSDVSAVNAMYQNLNSPGQLSKWTTSGGDPCGDNWRGVTCSGSRITHIQLPSLGLSGGIGFQLSSLTSLTNFDISNNNLGSQIPYSLPPNLQTLNLAGCGFTGTLPYSITLMASLKSLNVAHNQISGPLPDNFGGQLPALSTMDLSFNSFTGDLPMSFNMLFAATDMYLQNNQFTGTIDVLSNLPLKNLNVGNNKFTGWVPSRLKNINLQIDGNSWSSGPAPPPPPGTPASGRGGGGGSQNRQPSGNNPSPSVSSGGEKKSGIGGGAIAGIVISILVVGAIIAFFLWKRRSKKSSTDIEKTDDHSFAPVPPQPQILQETKPVVNTKTPECPEAIYLKPPPIDHQESFDDEDDFSPILVIPKKVSVPPPDVKSYSIADLQIATDNFNADNLLGEGSTGRVFRAQFEDGKTTHEPERKIDQTTHDESVVERERTRLKNVADFFQKKAWSNKIKEIGYRFDDTHGLLLQCIVKNQRISLPINKMFKLGFAEWKRIAELTDTIQDLDIRMEIKKETAYLVNLAYKLHYITEKEYREFCTAHRLKLNKRSLGLDCTVEGINPHPVPKDIAFVNRMYVKTEQVEGLCYLDAINEEAFQDINSLSSTSLSHYIGLLKECEEKESLPFRKRLISWLFNNLLAIRKIHGTKEVVEEIILEYQELFNKSDTDMKELIKYKFEKIKELKKTS